jgi:hypothetical protein
MGRGRKRQQSGDGNADERVQRVPDEVEGGNFICEEFDGEQREGGADDPPVGDEMQRAGQR